MSLNCITSEVGRGGKAGVPVGDQQTALALLLELAVQRGGLHHVLGAVTLLLSLWNNSRHDYDNRVRSNLYSAPLIPLLKRFQAIMPAKANPPDNSKWEEVWAFVEHFS